jgi:hypothetical protein
VVKTDCISLAMKGNERFSGKNEDADFTLIH